MRGAGVALAIGSLALAHACAAHAEWVLTLYTGASHTYASTIHVTEPSTRSDASFEGVPWAPHPFALGAPYYGVRLSYFPALDARLGVTIDFTHYKMYAETAEPVTARGVWGGAPFYAHAPLRDFVQHLEISHGVNLTSLDGEYRWNPSFARGPWQSHVGAGLLVYVPHAEGTVDGVGVSGDYAYSGWGGQIFGGAEYTLPRRWEPRWARVTLLVESKLDMGRIDLDLEPATRISTRVGTLHLIAGVSLHIRR